MATDVASSPVTTFTRSSSAGEHLEHPHPDDLLALPFGGFGGVIAGLLFGRLRPDRSNGCAIGPSAQCPPREGIGAQSRTASYTVR